MTTPTPGRSLDALGSMLIMIVWKNVEMDQWKSDMGCL
jgi:hypothetical protein